jgi:YidC/Oxa1 family membrane protein insertase
MDKKNTFIGILIIGAAFALMLWQGKHTQGTQQENAPLQSIQQQGEKTLSAVVPEQSKTTLTLKALPINSSEEEITYSLENEYIKVIFTNLGGAIKTVGLKKYLAVQDKPEPFRFNEGSIIPALGLSTMNAEDAVPQQYASPYALLKQDDSTITFRLITEEGLVIERAYDITEASSERDPYVIAHETRFTNNMEHAANLKHVYMHLGTVPPVQNDKMGEFLNFGYYNGDKAKFIKIGEFQGRSGFMGIGKKLPVNSIEENTTPILWGSLKNQFFTGVLTPQKPSVGFSVNAEELPIEGTSGETEMGIAASMRFDLGQLPTGETSILATQYYVGPKEYTRLEKLGEHQDLVMQFGIFGFISKLLLIMMKGIYSIIPNYGVAIIIVTAVIKLLTWPLTNASTRASKRMAKLQGPLKEIREKHKDNPQKAQQESMKLFKEYKVNPAAGCLPILIQIPIFLGLFWMLRSASELRFAHFLWIQDLSLPDTVATIAGFPFNILPLFMGVTMFFQMKMTPSPSADPIQRKVFQFMPFIFLVICYNFPSGLVLYWTVQNLLTITQQAITNRRSDPAADAIPSTLAETRKNKKRRKK